MALKLFRGVRISQEVKRKFWAKVLLPAKGDITKGCWIWTGAHDRYGNFYLGVAEDGKKRFVKSHIFSFWLKKGVLPPGHIHRHSCDNTICCNPDHLEPGSEIQNRADAIERNRIPKKYGKLTDHDRKGVIALLKLKFSIQRIAQMFGVSERSIDYVRYPSR